MRQIFRGHGARSLTRFKCLVKVIRLNVRWLWLLIPLVVNVAQANEPCDVDDVPCLALRIAGNPSDVTARLALGQIYLERAVLGSAEALDAALEQLDAIVRIEPRQALARANRGFAWVLQAGDDDTTAGQLRLARRGIGEIDAAVALAPENVAVRLVRAINAYQMPRWMERRAIADLDFAWLLAQLEADPAANSTLARKVLFHAGSHALKERRSEAIGWLERALGTSGGRPSDGEVQSMLALAREQFTPHDNAEKEKR